MATAAEAAARSAIAHATNAAFKEHWVKTPGAVQLVFAPQVATVLARSEDPTRQCNFGVILATPVNDLPLREDHKRIGVIGYARRQDGSLFAYKATDSFQQRTVPQEQNPKP